MFFLLAGECKIFRSATTFTVPAGGENEGASSGGFHRPGTQGKAKGIQGPVGSGGKAQFAMRTIRALSILGLDTVQPSRGEGARHKWTCVVQSDAEVLKLKRSDIDSVGIKNVSLRQLTKHYASKNQAERERAASEVSNLLQKALFPGGEAVEIQGMTRLQRQKKHETEISGVVAGRLRLGAAMALSGGVTEAPKASVSQVVLALLRLRAFLRYAPFSTS